jgi:hypothetical protein
MRGPLETNSKRYAAVAEKLEAARKHRPFSKSPPDSAGPA